MKHTKIALFALAALCLMATCSVAATVSLSWLPNSESDLAGYKVYYGTASRSYTTNVDVGNVVQHSIATLTEGKTYHFALTAYDTSGNESGYSEEVSFLVPVPAPIDTDPPGPPSQLSYTITIDIRVQPNQ